MKRRLLASSSAALAGLSLLALSGCTGTHVGEGVAVDGDHVSMQQINDLTVATCDFLAPSWAPKGERHSMAEIRRFVASSVASRLITDKIGAEQKVDLGPTYDDQIDQVRNQITETDTVSPDLIDPLADVLTANDYTNAVLTQAVINAFGSAATNELMQVGAAQLMANFVAAHDIEFNPELGLVFNQNGPAPFADQLSQPVSKIALRHVGALLGSQQVDQTYLDSLPDSQVCG